MFLDNGTMFIIQGENLLQKIRKARIRNTKKFSPKLHKKVTHNYLAIVKIDY